MRRFGISRLVKLSDEPDLSSSLSPPTLGSASVTLPKGFIIFNIIILRPLCFDEFFSQKNYDNLSQIKSRGLATNNVQIIFVLVCFFFLRSSCFARSCDCVTDWLRTLDSFMEYSTCNYGVQILIRQRLSIRAIPAVFQAHLIQLNLLIKNCLVTFFFGFQSY